MAPVQNIMKSEKQSQLERAMMSLPAGTEIKYEPADGGTTSQDEDFRGWDASVVKMEIDGGHLKHKKLVALLKMGHEETDKDSCDVTIEPVMSKVDVAKKDVASDSVSSRGDVHSKYSTPVLRVCGSSDSEVTTVTSQRVCTNLVKDTKLNGGDSLNEKNTCTLSVEHLCPECGKVFSQASKLSNHLKIHSADKPYRCSDCGKYFALQQHLDWHSRIHSEGSYYRCPFCRRKFSEQTNFGRHLLKTHPDEKPYKCFECGKPFVQASALKRHLKVHDGAMALEEIGRVDSMFLIEKSNIKVIEELQKKKITKSLEDKASPSKDSRNKPLSKDGEVENNLPRPHLNDKQVKKPQGKSTHQKRQLTEVGAKLKRIKNFISSEEQKGRAVLGAQFYNGHVDSSSDPMLHGKDNVNLVSKKKSESPDKLPLNGNGTNMESRLNSKDEELNQSRLHGRFSKSTFSDTFGESFSCRNCGESFRSKASLYNHVMCHIGMKLHDCSMCGKHFSETLSLERHYIYHITGSFPQECLRCGRHFFSYHDLRDHSQTHLADKKRTQQPVDQFKCNRCRKNFPSFRILEAHIRSRCVEDKRPGKVTSGNKFPSMKSRENTDNHMVVDVDPLLAFPAAGYVSDGSSKEEFNLNEPRKYHSLYSTSLERGNLEASTDCVTKKESFSHEEAGNSLAMLDCTECGKKVPGVEAMMLHVKEHLEKKPSLKCPITKCGKLFMESSDFLVHVRAHGGDKPFGCTPCDKYFHLKENYDKHTNRHETWDSIATIIGSSDTRSANETIKEEDHGELHEADESQWQDSSSESDRTESTPSPVSPRHSVTFGKIKHRSQPASGRSVANKKSCSNSSRGHTQKERMCASALVQLFRVSDSINALNVGSSEYRRYPRSGQCEVCLKFCSRLDKHMMVHLNQKPHLCPICSQAFRQSEHLKRHVRARHEGNHRVFECPLCFKKLTRKDKLKEHMRNCRRMMSSLSPVPVISTLTPISDRLFDVIPGPSR